jgi:hypothetical protein
MLTFSDLTYVLFPVLIVFRLKMPFRRKLGLILILMLSLITMVVSLMKTLQVRISIGRAGNLTSDIQYKTSLLQVWAGVEQSLVIILSCVPVLKAMSKTDFGPFATAASSIARLVSRKDWSTQRSTGSGKPDPSQYYDVEMQQSNNAQKNYQDSHDRLAPPEQIHEASGESYNNGPIKEHIHQTNEVTVSYGNAQNPSERV